MTKRQEIKEAIIKRAALAFSRKPWASRYMALDAKLPRLGNAGDVDFIERVEEFFATITDRFGPEYVVYEQGLTEDEWINLVREIIKEARKLA